MNVLLLAAALAAGLVAVLLVELRPEPDPVTEAASPVRIDSTAAPPAARPAAGSDMLTALLARPLFSATRRPASEPSTAEGAAATATVLPRMAAILIDGPRRSVIFAPLGGKPVVVGEGGRIGDFTVQRIEPGGVTIAGPDGNRTVRTSFDPALPPPAAPPLQLQLPGGGPPPAPPAFPSLSGAAR